MPIRIRGPQGRVGSTPTPGIPPSIDSAGCRRTLWHYVEAMSTALTLLGVAGVAAVLLRLVRALFLALRGGVDAFLARDVADTRAQRGDITGLDEAHGAARDARRRRLAALGVASLWAGLLIVPVLTPWPRMLYATYSLLWLLPRPTART
jgi:hypothetical protein